MIEKRLLTMAAASREPATPGALSDATQLGRLEAEAFDLELRDRERRDREQLLARMAFTPDVGARRRLDDALPAAAHGEIVRLQNEVARLAEFQRALVRSRSWRLLQWLKRPFGRAW